MGGFVEAVLERVGKARASLTAALDAESPYEVAMAQGVAGMVGDLAGYTLADWGFTPAEVAADVLLAYGRDDALVAPAHGEWYRDRLPSADLQLWSEVGHLVVVPAWERVVGHLVG